MTIANEVQRRNITEVVHFTTNRGIVGILASGQLLSRRRLPQEKLLEHILFPNAVIRPEESEFFDTSTDWLDYINLSISEINHRFFTVSQRWHRDKDIWWVIASFDPAILSHEGVFFATTNNKYQFCRRRDGVEGFQALFGPRIARLPNWTAYRANRGPNLTTCEQAEVLYPRQLSTGHLKRVYVSRDEDYDCVRAWLREFGKQSVEVINDPSKFDGVPN